MTHGRGNIFLYVITNKNNKYIKYVFIKVQLSKNNCMNAVFLIVEIEPLFLSPDR